MSELQTNIEHEYQRRLDGMTPADRVARGAAMFELARKTIARRLTAELGPMSEEETKWRVAMELYGDSETPRRIIQEQIDRVSG